MSTGFSLLADHPNLEEQHIEVETITLDALVDRYLPRTIIDILQNGCWRAPSSKSFWVGTRGDSRQLPEFPDLRNT